MHIAFADITQFVGNRIDLFRTTRFARSAAVAFVIEIAFHSDECDIPSLPVQYECSKTKFTCEVWQLNIVVYSLWWFDHILMNIDFPTLNRVRYSIIFQSYATHTHANTQSDGGYTNAFAVWNTSVLGPTNTFIDRRHKPFELKNDRLIMNNIAMRWLSQNGVSPLYWCFCISLITLVICNKMNNLLLLAQFLWNYSTENRLIASSCVCELIVLSVANIFTQMNLNTLSTNMLVQFVLIGRRENVDALLE